MQKLNLNKTKKNYCKDATQFSWVIRSIWRIINWEEKEEKTAKLTLNLGRKIDGFIEGRGKTAILYNNIVSKVGQYSCEKNKNKTKNNI